MQKIFLKLLDISPNFLFSSTEIKSYDLRLIFLENLQNFQNSAEL